MGIEVDWTSLEQLYADQGLAPRLPTQAWRTSVPLYDGDSVSVRYGFLYETRIPLSQIALAEAVEYAPLREYGGWGIRGSRRRRALNARGNRGVLLTRIDGSTLLVGSQRPRELLEALSRVGIATQDRLPIVVKDF